MAIPAIVLSGVLSMLFFYKMFYEPTHTERDTVLGVVMTEEGLQSEETRGIVRQYRLMQRDLFLASLSVSALGILTAAFAEKLGILLEIFRLILVWEMFFFLYQEYLRKVIFLKYDNQWLEHTAKHMCCMKLHIHGYSRETVSDLAFVPLFLLSFRVFFYSGVKEYLQGNLVHGVAFIVPFVILLLFLWIYYSGKINRNLVFFSACLEFAAMWMLQRRLIVEVSGLWSAIAGYLLVLIAGGIMLFPYVTGIIAEGELERKHFPEWMPTDGEEVWLYGYYRNKKDKSLWVKRKNGTGISLNYADSKAKLIALTGWLVLYSGMVIYIACLL